MKDDKKKLVVLGVLAAVILGVGAFSFLGGGSSTPPVAETAKKEGVGSDDPATTKVDENGNPIVVKGEGEEPTEVKNPLYASALPQRDPFSVRSLPTDPTLNPIQQPVSQPNQAPPRRSSPPRRSTYNPSIPPFDVSGPLPGAGGSVQVTPSGPDPSAFGYTVSGTMTGGKKPVAVFTDANGNQRMVPVGGSLDGDSKVISIEKGSVVIEHRGKKQRISQGGNPK